MARQASAKDEVEAKFRVESAAQASRLLAALGVGPGERGETVPVADAYHDTEDLALLRAGWGYRMRRRGDGRYEATAKSLGVADRAGVVAREERTAVVPHASPDPRLLPDGEPRRTVEAVADGRPLRVLARVGGTRTTWRLAPEPGLAVLVSSDRVTLSCRGRRARGDEVEAERIEGSAAAFSAWLSKSVRGARAAPSRGSKLERAAKAAGVRIPLPAEIALSRLAHAPAPGPSTPAALAASRELARLAESLRRSMAAARRGGIEGVHDLRTTARRLRTLLAAHGDELPEGLSDPLRTRLRALRRMAGAARDLDVLAETLRGDAAEDANPAGTAALLEVLAARRASARRVLAEALKSRAVASLPERIGEAAARTLGRASPALAIAGACRLPGYLERALARLAALQGGPKSAPAPALHALRVATKRARYAAEAFLPAFGGPLARFAEAAASLQDALGAVQDAITQREALRGLLAGVPSSDGRAAAAGQAAAAVSDALEGEARRGRKRASKVLARAYGEKALRSLGEHLMKRAQERLGPAAAGR